MKTTALLLLAVSFISQVRAADEYKIDPAHTSLTFSVRHMGISNVKGHFDDFTGTVVMDAGAVKEIKGTVKVKSVNTGVEKRDTHLKTADFFDVEKFPEMTFTTKSSKTEDNHTVFVANFTLRGVTKEVTVPIKVSGPAKDPEGKTRIGLQANASLNRKDYGIKFNAALESGAALVGEEVTIEINAEAVKVEPAKTK
jgi:polyisoprenoid-binding protein YceI